MKAILLIAAAPLFATSLRAQPVPRAVVVEHFTNTYCSVCAARNPGVYYALDQRPDVLHVAYHPSSPYAACPLNQQNIVENDARANYYGVYGATPRLVINGTAISANANYSDTAIYSPYSGGTSAFELRSSFTQLSATMARVRVVVYRRAADAVSTLYLYGAVVEDTLAFAANNGETMHYDVFRKAAPGTESVSVGVLNIGDSAVKTYTIPVAAGWNLSRMSLVAMLQSSGQTMVQAARVELDQTSLGVEEAAVPGGITLSPNPVVDVVRIGGLAGKSELMVMDVVGKVVLRKSAEGGEENLDVRGLQPGMYLVRIASGEGSKTLRFVKR